MVPVGASEGVHSRLTHTLQVAQVARRLAQRVCAHHPDLSAELDPDRVEAAALAHDLGHPPFGHIAEVELDRLARATGCEGFEGNAQTFRIVTRLALRWPLEADDVGLNLTRGTLDGLLKYPWLRASNADLGVDDGGNSHASHKRRKWGAYRDDAPAFDWVRDGRPQGDERRALAAEVMDWADDVTYAVHDMEDFYRAGLIPLDRLCTSRAERERLCDSFTEAGTGNLIKRLESFDAEELKRAVSWLFSDFLDFVEPYDGSRGLRLLLRQRTSTLVGRYMHAFEVSDGRAHVDPQATVDVAVLQQLTWFYVINRPELATVQEGQRTIIRHLFHLLRCAARDGRAELFPALERDAIAGISAANDAERNSALTRVVLDYIARLSEARALELHRLLCGVAAPAVTPSMH